MECGECTMCCELLYIKEIEKPANVMCKDCTLLKGCNIYETRPTACRQFNCAYLQMEKVNINMRPDHSKVIFEKVSDRIFFGTVHPKYDMTDFAKGQILAFMNQGFSVIIKSGDFKPSLYLAEGHTSEDIYNEFQTHLKSAI